MTHTISHHRPNPRRRSPRPAPALIGARYDIAAPEAEAGEGVAQLIVDLAVLVDAGLIAPVERHGAVRYAIADPDDPAA